MYQNQRSHSYKYVLTPISKQEKHIQQKDIKNYKIDLMIKVRNNSKRDYGFYSLITI